MDRRTNQINNSLSPFKNFIRINPQTDTHTEAISLNKSSVALYVLANYD